MSARNRAWLRSFLDLAARADRDGIPLADIERQEDTVLRALEMLDEQPGIVLADEVGMGKTYEALGVAAAMQQGARRCRIVVVTPGPDLNRKWSSEFWNFRELYDFGSDVVPAASLAEFVQSVRSRAVVVAPVTIFQSGRGLGAQAYILSLFFHWKKLHGHTANAIMARFKDGSHERVDVRTAKFLDTFDLRQLEPHLQKAFRRGRSGGPAGLDDLYESGGLAAFQGDDAVRSALYRARFVLTGKLMPMIDLLIVDEAHKLKNPGSLRTQAMRSVFDGRFHRALFLTATPFQLDVAELREIFSLFSRAKGAPAELTDEIVELLAAVADYQHQYESFQQAWSSLDPVVAARFRATYDADPRAIANLEDPTLKVIGRLVASLTAIKDGVIEPGFRRWMIRSLREDKRTYRKHQRNGIPATGEGAIPFLLYERLIAELFRRSRQTHKAAVEINMVSSFAAAQQGAIIATAEDIPSEAEPYRELLRDILGEMNAGMNEHPKVTEVIRDALDAADHGEKTLIFCSRVATLDLLSLQLGRIWEERILERWRRTYPGTTADDIFDSREDDERRQRGRHALLQTRFHRPQDALHLALREPYLRTVTDAAGWALANLPLVVGEANRILARVRLGKTAAERLNYQVAKRCVEQAAARLRPVRPEGDDARKMAMAALLHPDYVRLGLDLDSDEFEDDSLGDEEPRWRISEHVAEMVIGPAGSMWEAHSEALAQLPPPLRVRVVEQLGRYLTFKQVPFLADLVAEVRAAGLETETVESAAALAFMPTFWRTEAGARWQAQLRAFLEYFLQRGDQQRDEILNGPLRTVYFARNTADGDSRARLREAFNTPLYPMILIANEVMQEGLDLHKQCRRIVHHDLVWNPALIEQRIGRIDRLGSLTHRLRKDGSDAKLDVLYPVIRGTIDERLYQTVKTREKWLEFLLGAPPNFSEYNFTDGEPPPLPERLGADLAVDLGPR